MASFLLLGFVIIFCFAYALHSFDLFLLKVFGGALIIYLLFVVKKVIQLYKETQYVKKQRFKKLKE